MINLLVTSASLGKGKEHMQRGGFPKSHSNRNENTNQDVIHLAAPIIFISFPFHNSFFTIILYAVQ